jgi:RNA polymerase sigma factor (TIGR02999 family)
VSSQDDEQKAKDERAAFDELYTAVYQQLKALAAGVMRRDRAAAPHVSPTTLVHKAWEKMYRRPSLANMSRSHFINTAARAMRQVLVELARKRKAAKRDPGGPAAVITFNDDLVAGAGSVEDVLLINDALDRLARTKPEHASLFELCYFGGASQAEAAAALGITERLVRERYREAKLFLVREMKPADGAAVAAARAGDRR